mmetsp:Transcript_37287/g.73171  ORF Transcript_37287/g.73171 Transcript_37287/m.73171 type:complete len:102 (+) Transcript_37287:125-430(+)
MDHPLEDPIEWTEHLKNMIECVPLFDSPPREPWYRYSVVASAVWRDYMGKRLAKNMHPAIVRNLAIFEHNQKFVDWANNMKRVMRPTASVLTWTKRYALCR